MSIAEIFAAEKIKIPKHISTTITENHNKSVKSTSTSTMSIPYVSMNGLKVV